MYSFDARNSLVEKGSHWSDQTALNGRGFFQAKAKPAMFAIDAVKSSDTGLYRCRVDFQRNPTRNSKVNLTVISEYTSIYFFIWKILYKYTIHI